ncbi:MAG: phytochelatin synthase [Desulfosarcina sp.]
MNLLRRLIQPYLYLRYGFHRLTGTGAFASDRARTVDAAVHPQWNPLKQAIWRYHVKQFHDSSCSVATVVACINAIRSLDHNGMRPLGQADLLERVTTGHWKERMSDGGYRGRRGLPLQLLGRVVEESIAVCGLRVLGVDVVQTPKACPSGSPIRAILKKRLQDFDRHGAGLVIAHFDQGAWVPTLDIPHISPVGAYDAASERITMLDVDPEQHRPYEIDFETFYKGLSENYHHVFDAFGYGSGGYVYIRMR